MKKLTKDDIFEAKLALMTDLPGNVPFVPHPEVAHLFAGMTQEEFEKTLSEWAKIMVEEREE